MASFLLSSSQFAGLYGLPKLPHEFPFLPLIPLKERRCNLDYVFLVGNPNEVSAQTGCAQERCQTIDILADVGTCGVSGSTQK